MTLHRLWTQTTPPFGSYSDGQVGMTTANAFYVVGVSGWTCRGARVFWPAGTTAQTLNVYAWNADPSGNNGPLTVAQSATVQVVPGQWNEVVWPAPVAMSSAVPIWLGYSSQQYDDYIAWTGVPAGAVGAEDGSPVYLAGGVEFGGRGRYRYARNTLPTDPLTFSVGVDIVADDGAGGTPTFTAYPGMSVWDGATEKPLSAKFWDGTTEQPLNGNRPVPAT